MVRTNINKIRKIKYFFTLLFQKTILAIIAVDENILCRIITDLIIKGLSLNQIQEHLALIYCMKISKDTIRKIKKESAVKAKKINNKHDKEIASKIYMIEVDETFQGKKNLVLGAAEKNSQYLLKLNHSYSRDNDALTSFLKPIACRHSNIRIVITDLFKGYRKVIRKTLPKARHLGCNVHTQRAIMRDLDKIKASYQSLKRNINAKSKTLEKIISKIKTLDQELKNLKKNIAKDKASLKDLQKQKKESKTGRTKTIDKKIETTKKRIKRRTKKLNDETKEIKKLRYKRESLRKELPKLEKSYNKKHQEHLQASRLLADLRRILEKKNPEFLVALDKFILRLGKSKCSYAPKLLKMVKNNDHIFSLRKRSDLEENFQNSNTIERIFGILRPLLDSTRYIGSQEGTNEYCSLFRLYYNSTPRYSNNTDQLSPFEKLDGKLNGKNYLDLIYPLRVRTTHIFASELKLKTNHGFYVEGIRTSSTVYVRSFSKGVKIIRSIA